MGYEQKTRSELIAEIEQLRCKLEIAKSLENQSQMTTKELTTSEQCLRTLIDTIPDLICMKDGEGRWLEANRFCIDLFELDPKSYKGKKDIELAEESLLNSAAFKACETSDKCAWSNGFPTSGEEELLRSDGQIVTLDVIKAPIFYPDGRPQGIVVFGRNITERKKAEDALRRREQEFKTLVEHSPDIIVRFDRNGRVIYINPAAEHIFGLPLNQTVGKGSKGVMPKGESSDSLRKYLRHVFISKKSLTREGKFILGDISFHYHAYLIPEFDLVGRVSSVLVIARDITESKNMELEMARLDRLNLVGEMAAGIGHEVRNPMTTVRGFLQILAGKKDNLQYREYYNLMINELDRANLIITEFLSLAKDKAVHKEMTNLNAIINALQPLIKADGIINNKYTHTKLGDIPKLLLDEKEIRQLILNLAINGLESMATGGNLIIRTYLDNDDVILAVQDEGCGISADIVEKIGTPFFTTKNTGTGLGLAVCYSIANRHGASIAFDTTNEGTTFFVRFKPDNYPGGS